MTDPSSTTEERLASQNASTADRNSCAPATGPPPRSCGGASLAPLAEPVKPSEGWEQTSAGGF